MNLREHMKPLLRYYTYGQGAQVLVSSWPARESDIRQSLGHGLTAGPDRATDPYIATASACGPILTRQTASEGGNFALCCTGTLSQKNAERLGGVSLSSTHSGSLTHVLVKSFTGGGFTCIYGPDGGVLARARSTTEDEIVYADIDLDNIHIAKQMADCVGQ